jgi:two-component system OmpR family response regulator
MTITEGGAANRGVRILLEAVRESARRARERSVLRLETDRVVIGTLTLHPVHRMISGTGRRVALSAAEWPLLLALVTHRSAILTLPELAGHAWGPDFTHRHAEIEVYVNRLRRKLDRAGAPALIETVRGRGYRLLVDD